MASDIEKSSNWTSKFEIWSCLGRLKIETPQINYNETKKSLLSNFDEVEILPNISSQPNKPTSSTFSFEKLHVKKQLRNNFALVNLKGNKDCKYSLTDEQIEIFSIISSYCDLYHANITYKKYDLIMPLYCLHAVNHILQTRHRILHHNNKININKSKKEHNYRDQGYTRPKVLILLPFRHSAFKVINLIAEILFSKKKDCIQKLKKFIKEFGPEEEKGYKDKPEDFKETFKGDISEDFQIGMTLTKNSLKLYTDFYQSDIIVASPLRLRMTIENDGEATGDSAFLSSLEVLILDQVCSPNFLLY